MISFYYSPSLIVLWAFSRTMAWKWERPLTIIRKANWRRPSSYQISLRDEKSTSTKAVVKIKPAIISPPFMVFRPFYYSPGLFFAETHTFTCEVKAGRGEDFMLHRGFLIISSQNQYYNTRNALLTSSSACSISKSSRNPTSSSQSRSSQSHKPIQCVHSKQLHP